MSELHLGDNVEIMRTYLAPESVDAVVCDPPYGLEFMGKAWDSFRVDDPGTQRYRGERAGAQGSAGAEDGAHPARGTGAVAYGGGTRSKTSRCVGCGKRDQYRNEHACSDTARWVYEVIDPFAAPPASLAFQEWVRTWAAEVYRVLKPGGHLIAFGGTRMFHRAACGIEDAGFEVRDCLSWLYGSGFPKSMNASKQFAEGSELAAAWNGWGTALKPAWEPILLARKPLLGTVASGLEAHGVGAINIEGCRVGDGVDTWPASRRYGGGPTPIGARGQDGGETEATGDEPSGRWPANVVLDESAAALLDSDVGLSESRRSELTSKPWQIYGMGEGLPSHTAVYGFDDSGGPSRFFYTAKASRSEREAGLEGFETERRTDGRKQEHETGHLRTSERRNHHPTVKPIALMRWLVRMITPPGAIVMDPFMGSGSTGVAAHEEGCRFIGIELDPGYYEIAKARIDELTRQAVMPFDGEGV